MCTCTRKHDSSPRIEVGYLGHPAGTDTISTVDQDHRNDGDVPLRLDLLVVVLQIMQDGVVVLVEDVPKIITFWKGEGSLDALIYFIDLESSWKQQKHASKSSPRHSQTIFLSQRVATDWNDVSASLKRAKNLQCFQKMVTGSIENAENGPLTRWTQPIPRPDEQDRTSWSRRLSTWIYLAWWENHHKWNKKVKNNLFHLVSGDICVKM